ncbi:carbohydrate-binding protein [Fulvivirgaceae bacterium QH1ED-6-2]|nr:carbohydrate-binding protein [Parachryseolinea silvisoli]
MAANQKLFAMAHEMGHNIGFWHTDQTTGTIVPGTPATDPNSVMNSFVLPWNGFTNYDLVAVRYMYPAGSFTRTIQAENYSAMAGIKVEACTDSGGGSNIGAIETADWLAYNSINIPTSGTYRVEYRVASTNGGGRLSLDLNAGTTVLGAINIPSTGGWQTWTTVSHNVTINAGTYNVGIYAQAGGWNINWFRITKI